MAVVLPFHGGATMPELTTVSVQEAKLRTIPGRQGKFINEYAEHIQQVSSGQAGKLHVLESENPVTIRRRLASAATAMHIPLIIKRSGNDLYFWRKDGEAEQPRRKRSYTRRNKRQEETAEQYFSQAGTLEHETPVEESPELGHTPV
jgi:hypothetical protein